MCAFRKLHRKYRERLEEDISLLGPQLTAVSLFSSKVQKVSTQFENS
jgi:hypothetical protein